MITKKDIGRRVCVGGVMDGLQFSNDTGVICATDGRLVGVKFDNKRPNFHNCDGTCDAEFGYYVSEDMLLFVDDMREGHNNGGSTDYYKFNPEWKDCQDVIEDRKMNFAQGNIFKVAFCFNQGRHEASNYKRELNKIAWFVDRELNRIKVNSIT